MAALSFTLIMPAWITITADDLKVGKAAPLIDALASAALGVGQADPTEEVITNASNRIRAEIQSSGRMLVSATPLAIPPSLKSLAVRLIIWELQSRLNVMGAVPMSDQDNTDHRDDLRYLERIANGKVAIETPDDPIPSTSSQVETPSGSPTITENRRENRNARIL